MGRYLGWKILDWCTGGIYWLLTEPDQGILVGLITAFAGIAAAVATLIAGRGDKLGATVLWVFFVIAILKSILEAAKGFKSRFTRVLHDDGKKRAATIREFVGKSCIKIAEHLINHDVAAARDACYNTLCANICAHFGTSVGNIQDLACYLVQIESSEVHKVVGRFELLAPNLADSIILTIASSSLHRPSNGTIRHTPMTIVIEDVEVESGNKWWASKRFTTGAYDFGSEVIIPLSRHKDSADYIVVVRSTKERLFRAREGRAMSAEAFTLMSPVFIVDEACNQKDSAEKALRQLSDIRVELDTLRNQIVQRNQAGT